MGITDFLTGSVDKVVDSVGNALDSLFTSDEEKLILKNKLEQIKINEKLSLLQNQNEFEEQISKRWISDNEHWITRMVRPLSFIFVLFIFAIIILADGNFGGFTVAPAYIPVIETLLTTMVIAYFGSRGAEKVTKVFKQTKEG